MSLALQGHPRWPVIVKNSDKTCFINKKGVVKGEGGSKEWQCKDSIPLYVNYRTLKAPGLKMNNYLKPQSVQNFKIL